MRRHATRHRELPQRQTTRLYFRVTELRHQTVAARDISAAGWEVRIRVFTRPIGSLLLNVLSTKALNPDGTDGAVAAGSTGWVYADVQPTSARGEVFVQIVLVDTATTDATTVSGKREFPVEDELVYEVVETVAPGA